MEGTCLGPCSVPSSILARFRECITPTQRMACQCLRPGESGAGDVILRVGMGHPRDLGAVSVEISWQGKICRSGEWSLA